MPTSQLRTPACSLRWRRWIYASLLLLAGGVYMTERRLVGYAESPYPIAPTVPFAGSRSLLGHVPIESYPLVFAFAPGETLSDALTAVGVERAEIPEVVEELSRWADPRKIRPADQYSVSYGAEGAVESFELWLSRKGRARIARGGGDWSGEWRPFERTVKVRAIEGVLDSALESAIAAAGGETNLSILMADVFQWDLDFTRDLRKGDRFRILYETVYLDGTPDGLGSILGVSYQNGDEKRGRLLEAYKFGDDDTYYDAEGRPLKKMFLRSPLRYSRVTSRFSRSRFHPILKRYRPHYGVDYGAPVGTPVRATASGTVASAGWDGGGGKTVKIRHPNGYLTAYLHLSRFANGMGRGRRVQQGEVIGYVGTTGLSTAPHLDYRVQSQGRWIDPLSLKSVPADPVPHRRLPEFLTWRDEVRLSLNDGKEFDPVRVLEGARLANLEVDEASVTEAAGDVTASQGLSTGSR